MGLELFPHNQSAYEASLRLLEEGGKAAVIHPTGTGKSLIAFKLAKDRPNARICWLAPSEYIFKTQLENLRGLSGGQQEDAFSNITFLTYAKLMKMDNAAVESLKPEYIVLDEFHRCGAAEWGKSVERLLLAYPGAKTLGLSATNIRYLDSQRDMAEELFDGRIASEMTLGEAVVKEILPAPKYVISIYSYQEELKKLQKRISSIKNKGVRRADEEILEQLKRTLENADGLDKVFARHITKKSSKYIVFCTGREHMQEMAGRAGEWFGLVDREPHIYTAYYDNPETGGQFAAFKKDKSSHLKLLYCIDMLNEGIHVEDIDGVVLLRPTVSPILYLQQIGRCLAAGKKEQPVIFDIVNNFDSLYSVDSLKEEIREASAALGCTFAERKRLEGRFRIVDEAGDCRKIFDRLKKSLSAPWDAYYLAAEEYYRANGNLRAKKSYVTESGLALGAWLLTQRRVRAGKIEGSLTEGQIKKLDAIGMEWESKSKQNFDRGYEALAEYKKTYGSADVKADFVAEDGFKLGKWVSGVRQKKKNAEILKKRQDILDSGKEGGKLWRGGEGSLTEEQIEKLDALGMIWDKHEWQWEQNYKAAEEYRREHGNLDVPHSWRTDGGMRLGAWIESQRDIFAGRKTGAAPLRTDQIERLNALGMEWEKKNDSLWEKYISLARKFFEENGHLDVPSGYCADGMELGRWIYSLRQKRMNPESSGRKLTEERIRELDKIGMIWNKDAWEARYRLAADYYRQHGDLKVPANFVAENSVWLGKWVYEQKRSCREQTISEERKARLEKIGMEWMKVDKTQ